MDLHKRPGTRRRASVGAETHRRGIRLLVASAGPIKCSVSIMICTVRLGQRDEQYIISLTLGVSDTPYSNQVVITTRDMSRSFGDLELCNRHEARIVAPTASELELRLGASGAKSHHEPPTAPCDSGVPLILYISRSIIACHPAVARDGREVHHGRKREVKKRHTRGRRA